MKTIIDNQLILGAKLDQKIYKAYLKIFKLCNKKGAIEAIDNQLNYCNAMQENFWQRESWW